MSGGTWRPARAAHDCVLGSKRSLTSSTRWASGIEPGIAPDGLNVWIETDAQADALAARGWRVRPASAFAVGDAARAVRVTTSTITLEQAAAFAADLAEAR
jgi:hypothetical protein